MQEGPKLQTFYTCKDGENRCANLHIDCDIDYAYFECKFLPFTIETTNGEIPEFIKTPIDCPLLGKAQEYDVRFDKDVLMRNL